MTRRGVRLFGRAAAAAALALAAAGCAPRQPAATGFDGWSLLAALRGGGGAEWAKAYELARRAEAGAGGLDGYVARFEKQERLGGTLRPVEEIDVVVREDPFSVRMRWVGRVDRGKEAVYVDGRNDDRIRVYAGHLPVPLVLDLAPDSGPAMEGNRYPITRMGLRALARGLLQNRSEPQAALPESFAWLGRVELDGQTCDVVGRRLVSAAGGAGDYALYCLDARSHLAVLASRYDADGRLLELYRYRDVKRAAHLTDADFELSRVGQGK